jgi:DNA repair exonuclease SbcCD ATPase subunit
MDLKLAERFSSLHKQLNKLSAHRDVIRSQISSGESQVQQLKYTADLHQKSSEVFKGWLEDLLESNVNSIADLATSGLHNIIHDQALKFVIKQEMKYNRLSMRFAIESDGAEGDPMSSFGGGAVLVVSLILRLAIMSRMNMAKLLLLDESMFALANHYVPAAADFMRQLSERTGINILMVTHNDGFLDNAHTAYEGRKDGTLKLLKRRSS